VIDTSSAFEEHLEEEILLYRGSSVISDMLLYHFGYPPYGPARRGKRLRPQLVMRIAQTHGAHVADALDAAVAVELLHNYSLVHDDIEDRDELRHGRPTLWARDGVAQAINTGDAMCAISFLALAKASGRHDAPRVLAMVEALHEAHRVMCNGQSLDLKFETATHVALDEYEFMIACKTGALFEASCFLGALSAGCDDATVAEYGALGRAYGNIFQIRDDVLGVWASSDATGKMAAHDIARRKWSYPVVWALGGPPSPARDAIAQAYALRRSLNEAEVSRVVAALETLGAQEAARRAVAEPMALVERHPNRSLRDYLLGTLELPA
jgi:geranylgeranyl diphosphate synthase type I